MSDDEYVKVNASLVAFTPKAVQIENELAISWVPRSCIHAADDLKVCAAIVGEDREWRVRRWVAEREGFTNG